MLSQPLIWNQMRDAFPAVKLHIQKLKGVFSHLVIKWLMRLMGVPTRL